MTRREHNPNEWEEQHDGVTMIVRICECKCDCCKERFHGEFIFKPTGAEICRGCFGE